MDIAKVIKELREGVKMNRKNSQSTLGFRFEHLRIGRLDDAPLRSIYRDLLRIS